MVVNSKLSIVEGLVLKQFILGIRSPHRLSLMLGMKVSDVRSVCRRLQKMTGCYTMQDVVKRVVRGDDKVFYEPFDKKAYAKTTDRKAQRERSQRKKDLQLAVCQFIAQHYLSTGQYATDDDVVKKFLLPSDEIRAAALVLDYANWIEILRTNPYGSVQYRPLAVPSWTQPVLKRRVSA